MSQSESTITVDLEKSHRDAPGPSPAPAPSHCGRRRSFRAGERPNSALEESLGAAFEIFSKPLEVVK